jgi:hypothetical protein
MGFQSAIDRLSADLGVYLSRLASAAAILLLSPGAALIARRLSIVCSAGPIRRMIGLRTTMLTMEDGQPYL